MLLSIGTVWQTVWPILVAILLFGVVIFIHECGHFLFAKLFHVKVNEFAIGFGPTLFRFGKGETTYSLRLLPFGGFCSMEGEDEESDNERAFSKKPVWKRLVIVVAGAMNNLILGLILVGIMLAMSGSYGTRQVHSFITTPEQPVATSESTGLRAGDEILKIDGRNIYCATDVTYMLMNSRDNTLDMVVSRDGVRTDLTNVTFHTDDIEGHSIIRQDFMFVGKRVSIKSPLAFVKEAFLETVSLGRMIWMSLFDLITGRYGLNEVMGPVGIINETGKAVASGLDDALYLLALLTVNLGIMNLLPIPAVDGGRIVFLVIEGIRRKPVPAKYEGWVHGIGLLLLLLLSVFIMGNDIFRLIRGGS